MHSVRVENERCARSWTFQPPSWPLFAALMFTGFRNQFPLLIMLEMTAFVTHYAVKVIAT